MIKDSQLSFYQCSAVRVSTLTPQKYNANKDNADSLAAVAKLPQLPVKTEAQRALLPTEAAVAIVINGIHYAVLMASPVDLDYLAVGFLCSEGLVNKAADILDWQINKVDMTHKLPLSVSAEQIKDNANDNIDYLSDYGGFIANITVTQRCHQQLKAQRRMLAGRTGCGMCGITGLSQAIPDLKRYRQTTSTPPSLKQLLAMQQQLSQQQQTHLRTGAVHAAAIQIDEHIVLFEDVGRHNALDKLIGYLIRHKIDNDKRRVVIMTSRLSIELVQKCIRAQISWLVGMSAPTGTAVLVAKRYGLGLAGFLRDNRVTYYHGY